MIVFPLIRSVRLKAATASSRAATLPMLSEPTSPCPLDDLIQSGVIGYDDEIDSNTVSGPRLGWAGDGHQRLLRRESRPQTASRCRRRGHRKPDRPCRHLQAVVIEVDELLCAEAESRLTAASAPRADDVCARLTCELARHRTDDAGRTVHEDALPRVKAAVLEQPLPRG